MRTPILLIFFLIGSSLPNAFAQVMLVDGQYSGYEESAQVRNGKLFRCNFPGSSSPYGSCIGLKPVQLNEYVLSVRVPGYDANSQVILCRDDAPGAFSSNHRSARCTKNGWQ